MSVELLDFMRSRAVAELIPTTPQEAALACRGLAHALNALMLRHIGFAKATDEARGAGTGVSGFSLRLGTPDSAIVNIATDTLSPSSDYMVEIVRPTAVHVYNGLLGLAGGSTVRMDYTPAQYAELESGEVVSLDETAVDDLLFDEDQHGVIVDNDEVVNLINYLRLGDPKLARPPAPPDEF